eukprot:g6174.t1
MTCIVHPDHRTVSPLGLLSTDKGTGRWGWRETGLSRRVPLSRLFAERSGQTETPMTTRFWSNVNSETLKHEPGNVVSSAALVAGTTIGAGMLALPSVTQSSGFVASTVALCGVCVFSIVSGLLIAEVNINTMCELGSGGVSLTSMAERTLGKTGTRISSTAYVLLHYALLVAYISRGGEILGEWLDVPSWIGGIVFANSLGALCYVASPSTLGKANGVLVGLVIVSFLALVSVASTGVDTSNLLKADWLAIPPSLSILSLAFVYQNVVPVITTNLEGDIKKVRSAILIGSFVALSMFIAWDATILGSLPIGSEVGDPLDRLKQSVNLAGPLIQGFSIFALATSYIGFVLGLTDFIADALRLPSGKQPIPYLLTLVPSCGLASTYPDIFLKALDFAGTYGVLVLFGIIPALMAWSERYNGVTISSIRIVPGGKLSLILIGGLAMAIIANEFWELIGVQKLLS